MSGVKDITPDLDRLDSQLDRLEDALAPLLRNLGDKASQLPLLDRAKLFSLTAYSIESLLFSYLRLQGADAQGHAVYAELKRVQQYFGKIQAAEEPEAQRTLVVNQEAAARVLKADLADNKSISSRLAEKIAEERARALLKSVEGRKRPGGADDAAASGGSGSDAQGNRKRRQKGKARAKQK
ncbi:exosome-associated family protein [Metarhizium album ARSEF 1941]|uniref:Exosome complex protein n=1 Tax=Metarhizium album (strain ARSEF 1941) TaxID=1081103 RepID=A0A0B2WZ27_METAS|nr:exosome-associated family protein [Metarhizium album ARSEF 1941]KHN98692.1 exosome-associated family protein [Metarhizium album ARSEF 1941]